MPFIIDGVQIKNPSTFKVERYNVTTMTRLSNASMTGDLIAQKLKFYFTYDAISATDFDKILDAVYNSKKLFFTLSYPNGNSDVSENLTAEVYVGSIPADLHRGGSNASNWVWKNVTFNLIER